MNLFVSTPALDVYEQMAFDEQTVRLRPQEITLRFYRWTDGSAVTFGYAQFLREVEKGVVAEGFFGPKARRPTGGGLVFHRDDLTFSLVFPSQERPTDIYKKLHGFILRSLAEGGQKSRVFDTALPASAYTPSVNNQASACFAEDGHKILGGAIRRFGQTVLYQGSLQLSGARENAVYKNALIRAVRTFLATDLRPAAADAKWLEKARALAKNQYQTLAWTEKF